MCAVLSELYYEQAYIMCVSCARIYIMLTLSTIMYYFFYILSYNIILIIRSIRPFVYNNMTLAADYLRYTLLRCGCRDDDGCVNQIDSSLFSVATVAAAADIPSRTVIVVVGHTHSAQLPSRTLLILYL